MIEIVGYISLVITVLSIAIIIYGVILEFIAFLRNEIKHVGPRGILKIRAGFGSYLLLGLEFLIAADIIKSVIDPTYQELIILAGIVILRTILSVFLNKEANEIKGE